MGKLYIEELDIAYIQASTYQIVPPKEDDTHGMLGDKDLKKYTTMQFDALPPFIFF